MLASIEEFDGVTAWACSAVIKYLHTHLLRCRLSCAAVRPSVRHSALTFSRVLRGTKFGIAKTPAKEIFVLVPANAAMPGSYDYLQVELSALIAMPTSYAALDLAGRVTAESGWARWAWLTGGATAIGTGISATHYGAILGFRLPVPVGYHWPTVLESPVL